ncbi:lipase secretion chaperone [Paraburkholderia sp. BL21I4N1]|uniref:lipase secretion chaperone n=1 Tax=Paraburkholderia sp. BL21I4N1 TaxID=1938801 RepID=UPI000CFAE2DD|nr:lipase secretion chaperone [Paraburkholderia sp. BL21I4N1]PQV48135.1 lipase chaperone LimK [Paraburkholderia sp. BL21I4N1]
MAQDERQRGGARKQWVAYVAVGVISAGAALWVNRAPTVPQQTIAQAGQAGRVAQTAPALGQAANASAAGALPASLDGSSPPRLPTDGHGRLARTRAVRDFFDYFLTTQNEIPATTLDALVRRQIAAQLDGTPAADEALNVWQRYNAYLSAVGKLPQTSSPSPSPTGARPNLDALQLELDQRDALGTRLMGEWNTPFFGAESQQQHTDLARLRIASDASLSDAQKAARLAALDAALPPEVRAAHERIRQQQAALDTLSQAQAQAQKPGGSLDAMRAQITQTLGPEAAERAVKMQQADNAWQARYADYANQRAQIDKQNLPAQQRDAQVTQLRQQFFTNPGEAMRAASLDRGSGSGG